MDIVAISMGTIRVGQRQRLADAAKVADLAASIEQVGLLQPIGVAQTHDGETYRLVFGLHRLQAMQLLERVAIDAYVLPPDLHEEEYLLIELQENSARHDLTGAQRKAYAGEIGRLLSHLAKNSHLPNGNDSWLSEMGKRSGTPQTTMYRWWQTFCEESGLAITPRQALDVHKQRFFTWLEAQQQAAEAERQRKAEEAERAERETYLHGLHAEVEEAILLYGWDVVYTTVLAPVLEAHDA